MFEKKSKEYANNWLEHVKDLELQHKSDEKPEYIRILEAHQKGAEYGYNKANEWHYVKDILPKEDVYVYLLCNDDDFPVVARRHIFYGKTEWEWDCKWGSGFQLKAENEKIIAWKEIVLPELKESIKI